jgi:hypothetical protein
MNAPSPNMMNAPRAPVAPMVTTNASKPAAGMARHVNVRNVLILIAVLVGAYMAWPMVFPTKPTTEPVVEVIEEEKDQDQVEDLTEEA